MAQLKPNLDVRPHAPTGYCYKRHEEQFNDVQHIMSSIANVCLMARANLEDQAEVYRLWRYVNAMHCTAYCGLTDHLTEANFFNPLSKKHGLLGSAKIREVESAAVRNIGIDDHGVRACSMFEVRWPLWESTPLLFVARSTHSAPPKFALHHAQLAHERPGSPGLLNGRSLVSQVWAMEVIRAESNRCKVPAPIQAKLQDGVTEIGLTIQKLFATRYQVINNAELLHDNLWHNHPQRRWSIYSPSRHQVLPFIYTHLVSALSTFYLMVTAFLIGLHFEPGEPAVFFICLSLIGLFVAILSTFGLLEVGSTILDPFGEDPEDFALMHFVEYAMGVSREAIDIQSCSIRGAHAEFYSPGEIAAAFKIFKSLVRRFRWRQIIVAARKARSLSSLPLGQTCQQMLPLSQPRNPPRPRQKPRSVRRDDAGRRCAAYGVVATQSAPNLSC